MLIKNAILIISVLLFSSVFSADEEIKDKKFTIQYDSLELKYFATQTKEVLILNCKRAETLCDLEFKRKFLVVISSNTENLASQKKINENELIKPDSDSSMNILFTPPCNYHSTLPYQQLILKKLLYILFRQNKIPENIYWEEAIFDFTINDEYGLGLISHFDLKFNPIFVGRASNDMPVQDLNKPLALTNDSLNLTLQRIQLAKTILVAPRKIIYQNENIRPNDIKKYLKKIKAKNFPHNISNSPSELFINEIQKKRQLYQKIMGNFNYPNNTTSKNISQNYVFRMILRLLVQKQNVLANQLFEQIKLTPATSPYFPELGLYFAHKNKTSDQLFLEYYLINQAQKKPIDFENPDQVSILLQETLSEEMPDFKVTDKELDIIRTLQYLLYMGKTSLVLEIINLHKEKSQSIETKNYFWAIGILLSNPILKKDFESNHPFYKSYIWQESIDVLKK